MPFDKCGARSRSPQLEVHVHKQGGSTFPPNSLHHIAARLMRYLRWNGQPKLNFFNSSDFVEFQVSLDTEMKRLQGDRELAQGRGMQSQILTEEDEELLWTKGILDDSTPKSLLVDTNIYKGSFLLSEVGRSIHVGNYTAHSVK